MVDKLHLEKKRSAEKSRLCAQVTGVVKEILEKKGVVESSGPVNPADPDTPHFDMSLNPETGETLLGFTFTDAFYFEHMQYVFYGGDVRKEGALERERGNLGNGEFYFGHFTDEQIDFAVGANSDDPNDLPRDDMYFNDPIKVDTGELRIVAEALGALEVNAMEAERLVDLLPRLNGEV